MLMFHCCFIGYGCNSWLDGQEYSGEWKRNSRNGKLKTDLNRNRMVGNSLLIRALFQRLSLSLGRGTHTWPDGRKVAGQWKDGHLDGKLKICTTGPPVEAELRRPKFGQGTHCFCLFPMQAKSTSLGQMEQHSMVSVVWERNTDGVSLFDRI